MMTSCVNEWYRAFFVTCVICVDVAMNDLDLKCVIIYVDHALYVLLCALYVLDACVEGEHRLSGSLFVL